MNSYFKYLLIILSVTVIFAGCSSTQTSPVAPIDTANLSGHELSGIYTASFDLENQTATVIPDRESATHINVTSYLPSPTIHILSYDPVTHVVDVDFTILNPYKITAYDVRLIIYTDSIGHKLLNPDSWTSLFDIAGGLPINPFMAFQKEIPLRAFSDKNESTVNMQILLPGGNPNVRFAIEVSYPGNCDEPFEINGFSHTELFDLADSTADAYVTVLDWQDDVSSVQIYCPSVTGAGLVSFAHLTGDQWYLQMANSMGASAGDYTAYLLAFSTNSGTLPLYTAVTITVTHSNVVSWKNISLRDDSPARDLAVTPEGDLLILYDDAQVWKYYESKLFQQTESDYLFTASVVQNDMYDPGPTIYCNYRIDVSGIGNIVATREDGGCGYPIGQYPSQNYDSTGNPIGVAPSHCTGGPVVEVFAFSDGSGDYYNDHVIVAPGNDGNQSNMYRWDAGAGYTAQLYGQDVHGYGYNYLRAIDIVGVETQGANSFWALEDADDYYCGRFYIPTGQMWAYFEYDNAYFGTGTQSDDDSCWYNAKDLTMDSRGNLYVLDLLSDGKGVVKGFTGDVSGGSSLGHFDVPDQFNSTPVRIEGSGVIGPTYGNLIFVLHGNDADGYYLSVFEMSEIPW
jgi:hypothetical protein